MSKENASSYPCFYYAKHLLSGLVGYEDETILVDQDALKEMMPTFVGKPIVVFHKDINVENLEEKDGTVIESFYNELDGCAWVKMLIETDSALTAIGSGWGVSNCYQPTEWAAGGRHNNLPYNRRMVNGVFKHLAIVPNPRYEDAKIYTPAEFDLYQKEKKDKLALLQNAIEGKKMIKFFKMKREEVKEADEDTLITLDNGKEISLKEMINAVTDAEKQNAKKKKNEDEKEEDEEEEKANMDQEVDVDGEKMPVRELVNRYKSTMKKNSEDAKKAEQDKKNAADAAEKAKQAQDTLDAENRKNYDKLMNAAHAGRVVNGVSVIQTGADKLALGQSRYGSVK